MNKQQLLSYLVTVPSENVVAPHDKDLVSFFLGMIFHKIRDKLCDTKWLKQTKMLCAVSSVVDLRINSLSVVFHACPSPICSIRKR
jgi:hypothetical protein